jgi:alpha-galactosidase
MNSGRPIVFNIDAGFYQPWMVDVANVIRNTTDIQPNFPRMVALLDSNDAVADTAGPGHWNDIDMMEVGDGMSAVEDQSHFTMWCIASAPLIAGNDIRTMSATTKSILTNPEVVAVDQDISGVQGKRVASRWSGDGNLEVWCKPLGTNGTTKAVALFNRTSSNATITAHWREILLQPGPATVRDLWSRTDLGTFYNSFAAAVPSHGVKLLKVIGTASPDSGPLPLRVGTNYLSDLRWNNMTNGWGPTERDLSNGEGSSGDGQPLTLHGVVYPKGLGAHAFSSIEYYLGGGAVRFQSVIGVDDEACSIASILFQIWADGVQLYTSPPMTPASAPINLDLNVTGRMHLTLIVNDTKGYINCDHADWADAKFIVTAASSPPRVDLANIASNQLVLSGHSGTPNATFYLVGSVDATAPSSQWTRSATNQFDDGGYFYFTNRIDSTVRQSFFRLVSP